MGQYNLNRIFKPEHIAVVGASKKPGSIGNAVMTNLIQGNFSGKLLPVNPKIQNPSWSAHLQVCFRLGRGYRPGGYFHTHANSPRYC